MGDGGNWLSAKWFFNTVHVVLSFSIVVGDAERKVLRIITDGFSHKTFLVHRASAPSHKIILIC